MLSLKFNFTRIFTSIAIASIAIFIFLQILAPVQAATGINRQINFQGKLVNNPAATNVTDTSYTIVFTLYDNATGANTALWTETQTVTTVDGIFRVALGSVTPFPANFNFNWSGLYLGINVNSNGEMVPRIQMAAVPFAFNAQQVAGLTVQDTSGNASTSGTLQVANGVTVKLPVSGTGLIYADTASTGTLATLSNSTTQTGNVIGQAITLAGATGSLNQTGLQFNLSGATSGTVLDIQGTSNSWYITRAGALTVASCTGCGGAGSVNYWGLNNGNGTTNGGLLYSGNTTADLAIGGTSTASALFSFSGVLTGKTIASASGNLILMANNGWGGQLGIGYNNPGTATLAVNGNVGIGTTSPGNKLSVNVGGTLADGVKVTGTFGPLNSIGNGTYSMDFGLATQANFYSQAAQANDAVLRVQGAPSNGNLILTTQNATGGIWFTTGSATNNDTVKMAILNNGAVGIGTNLVGNGQLVVNQTNFAGTGDIFAASASGTTKFVITNAGSIGLYGTNPSITNTGTNTLTLNSGSTGNIQFFTSSNTLSSAGNLTLAGTTGITLSGNAAGITFSGTGIDQITTAANQHISINAGGTGLVGINTDGIAPLANFDVRANVGTIAVASVSGKTSYAAFVVDNAGNAGAGDLFTASASGATRFVIAQNGTVTIGNSTDGLVFNPTAGTNPVAYSGNARPAKVIHLSPEYAGAVLTASGSAFTNGSMTSDASPSAAFQNYYEWSSTQASLQDYTVAVRVMLPNDFSAWATSNAITIDFNTATINAPQNKFDLIIFNQNDAKPTTPVVMRTANVSSVAKTWQTLTIPSSALTGGTATWQTAGHTAVFYIKMYAGSPAYVQVGDVMLNYLSKF